MPRLILTFLLLAVLGRADIRDLATVGDGHMVLFATDLRLAGTADGGQGKIYKWDNTFSVVNSPTVIPLGFHQLNMTKPVISDDGEVIGYSWTAFITGSGEYVYQGKKVAAIGNARLSRNGRYGLQTWFGGGSDGARIDLPSGELSATVKSVWGLTNLGSLLTLLDNSLYLAPPAGPGHLVATFPGKLLDAALDANGARVVYVVQHDGLLDLRDGNSVLVSMSDQSTGLRAELSADGSRLLVVETILGVSRAYWIQQGLPARNDLGVVRGGAATISGDGKVVWLVQEDGRLTRVKLDSNERESMNEALPARPTVQSASVRGSLIRLQGPGLGDGPWQVRINSEANLSNSLAMTVREAKSDHLDFQIPWNLSDFYTYSFIGMRRPGGIFEVVLEWALLDIRPQFWSEPTFYTIPVPPGGSVLLAKAIHQGFDRQVTPGDPARAGEVVHLYMSGLGPVAPVQLDNTPAAIPPPLITTPLVCSFVPNISARVLFAGLAVGMVGVYQVELEIPSGVVAPVLTCTVFASQTNIGSTGYLPVAP